ncbi:MAG: hypothetical protein IKP53_08375 [Candidatus Methanomethylophilaceae archaeon]|nr:hypothetical protein [Candidatus Methanomethylophilaceae archaeon]
MEPISIEKTKEIAANKGIKPGRVKGTEKIQLTKGTNPKIQVIGWDEFEKRLKARGLAVFEQGGWMKIMRARR